MARHEQLTCREVRETLQDLHDQGMQPGGRIALHLEECAQCARFQDFLRNLGGDLREAVERPLQVSAEEVIAPSLPRAKAGRPSTRARRGDAWRVAIPAIAAFLAISAATTLGLIGRAERRAREETRLSVAFFVDGLFDVPPLVDTEYLPASFETELSAVNAEEDYGIGMWLEGD